MKRVVLIVLSILFIFLAGIIYYRYYFVFGDGVKAGTMNYFVHKGYIFKTYEGRVIQSGVRSPVQGSIQSNEFVFSVVDQKVANQLNNNAGAYLELHYKEYISTLHWRGMSNFVVDSVVSIKPISSN